MVNRNDELTRPVTLPPRDEEITRPITLPPRPKCGKPDDSFCMFRDPADGSCAKRITTCRYKVKLREEADAQYQSK